MKVLLISANTETTPYPVYPLGLDYVAGALRDRHQVEIIDMNAVSDDEFISMTRTFSPDIVGLSLRNVDNTNNIDPRGYIALYSDLVARIKTQVDVPIVLGGSGFTLFPEEIIHRLDADFGIVGEGERFAEFLDILEKGGDPAQIPGVLIKGGNTRHPGPFGHSIKRDFRPDRPHTDFYLKKGGMLNLQTRRGCSFQCIYCTYPHIEGTRSRRCDPSDAAQTAKALEDAGAGYFFITDSTFNGDYDHSLKVAKAFIREKITIPWGAFFTPTLPPDGYYETLAEAGLKHVEFGTESMSDKMLKVFRKPFTSEHVFQAHGAAINAGLHVAHYLLPGGPGETAETIDNCLDRVDKLKQTVLFFFCGIRIYPNTRLHEIAVNEGIIKKEQNLLQPVFYRSRHIDSEEILDRVKSRAGGRMNWVIGAGGDETADILSRMYEKGYVGPLWEYLIR